MYVYVYLCCSVHKRVSEVYMPICWTRGFIPLALRNRSLISKTVQYYLS